MSFSSGKNLSNNINLNEAQTLQNKTIDSTNTVNDAPINNSTITGASLVSPTRSDVKKDTQANLETYAATATEGQLVYATDTKTMYQIKNNALSEVSGGAGGINYIENSDFEINLDGYTDDVNLTLARTTLANEILRGSASGKISKAAVDASGQEISIPFTVDRAGLASKITVSLEVDASDANYADGDLRLAVRQDPNGTPSIIRLNGEDIKGGKGKVYAQFQSDATITEYELLIQCNSANALAYDVIIDDVKVGPREVAYGSLVTDWKSYTPTNTQGFGTISNVNLEHKRVGDSLLIRGEFTIGTTSGDEAQIELPDSLIISQDSSSTVIVGSAAKDNTTSVSDYLVLATNGDSFLNFGISNTGNAGLSVKPANVVFNTGERVSFFAEVPIQGWSSNAVSSEDLGGREVVVEAEGNAGETLVGISAQNVPFIAIKDTTASWNGTEFTCPESGTYDVSGSVRYTANVTTPAVQCAVDRGSGYVIERLFGIDQSGSARTLDFSGKITLNKGDKMAIRVEDPGTLENNTISHNLHIQKLASPQTILETETVAARYTSDSGQTVSSGNNFVFEDLDFDTHNAYNVSTGVYTVPISGLYDIEATALNANNVAFFLSMELNGSEIQESQNNDAEDTTVIVRTKKMLNKGDEIQIVNSAGSNKTLTANGNQNTFSIARLK